MFYINKLALEHAVQAALIAQTEGAQPAANPFGGMGFMLAAMLGIMFFVVWMPNRRREKERQNMLNNLQKGDKVVTAGGVFGTIVGTDQIKAVVRVCDEPPIKVEFLKTSIARVLTEELESDKKKK